LTVDRYTRQRRLAEVGDEGQARIAAARLSVGDSPEAWSEREYLERAGAGTVTTAGLAGPPFAHAAVFRHPASRRLAAGSWRALAGLRRLLPGLS
jgi:hypothetical protein